MTLNRYVRDVFELLEPQELISNDYIRMGNDNDGGYVMVDDFSAPVAYSFGINDDTSWDEAVRLRGPQVLMFDHTVDNPHKDFSKRKLEASGINSLRSILIENGHLDYDNLIMKMDIECDEWEVFAQIESETLRVFEQIIVEFHDLEKVDINYLTMMTALTKLREQFVPVHVHANNFVNFVIVDGIAVPPVLEVTYCRNKPVKSNTRIFPTSFDQPNNKNKTDLFLGTFQWK